MTIELSVSDFSFLILDFSSRFSAFDFRLCSFNFNFRLAMGCLGGQICHVIWLDLILSRITGRPLARGLKGFSAQREKSGVKDLKFEIFLRFLCEIGGCISEFSAVELAGVCIQGFFVGKVC